MPDSTHTFAPVRRLAAARSAFAAFAVLAATAALALVPALARADGDPASDVLATQSLFLPQDAGISGAQQAQLSALVTEAQRDGVPLRVAVIANSSDLGSITQLWRMPATYSQFLGQELSLVFHGTLIVLMPNGVGIYREGGVPTAARSAAASASAPGTGRSMGSAAVAVVERVSAALGHPLAVEHVVAPKAVSSGSVFGGPVGWLVLAGGAILIAVAWTASLRVQPARDADHARASG